MGFIIMHMIYVYNMSKVVFSKVLFLFEFMPCAKNQIISIYYVK